MDTAQEAKVLFKTCPQRITEYDKEAKKKKDATWDKFVHEYFPSLEYAEEIEMKRKKPAEIAVGKKKKQQVTGRTIDQAEEKEMEKEAKKKDK